MGTQTKSSYSKKISKFRQVAVLVAILAVIAVFIYLAAKFVDTTITDNESKSSVESALVSIGATSFSPETIVVTKGQSVTWTNTSTDLQTLSLNVKTTEGTKVIQNSDSSISPNEAFSYTFNAVGTYTNTVDAGGNQFSSTIIVKE